ncbi:MAG: sensor histidine kinase [Eubacteriales bacterium]|jgi:two-component system sensor histidine kinase YesM|nr:sensor histidine kinase [Eubacteriales bacterium]MDD4135380.1 sensor histidine kinase [Eubacteriales bacterium]
MNAMAHFPLLLPTRGPLSRRLTISFRTIMIMMLVPALLSIAMLTSFSQLYYSFLTRAEKINSLSVLVVDTLPAEMFSIAAGRKRFPEGRQDALMAEIQQTLDSLISERPASELELTVALRTSETMGKYIQQMGQQMQSGSAVDEDMLVLEEIRNVSSLLGDMFTDAVSAEIRAANATSQQLRAALFITVALETALVAFALAFIRAAGGALSRAVANPLADLQAFAGKIADGQLDERTPEPDVDELRDLSASLNVMAGKLDGLIKENKREQENLKKSELRVLQAQVTPHFLYNTLDAIVWLAEARKNSEVIAITRALSDFYRISLSDGHDWITVAQEEEHLRGYLTIQKIRYRDILDYDIRIDPTLKNEMILKLSIQPLVENALYHGIKNRRGGGSITIDVRRQEGSLYVHVSDNGIGMAPERLRNLRDMLSGKEPSADSGFGLYSVDQRIKLYYDQPQGLKVDSALGQGTAISFSVPLNHQAR